MKTTKFQFATISSNNLKKEYGTLSGFKRGLKANNCPFEVDNDGLFNDIDGKLKRRQWSIAGRQFAANVEIK